MEERKRDLEIQAEQGGNIEFKFFDLAIISYCMLLRLHGTILQ